MHSYTAGLLYKTVLALDAFLSHFRLIDRCMLLMHSCIVGFFVLFVCLFYHHIYISPFKSYTALKSVNKLFYK